MQEQRFLDLLEAADVIVIRADGSEMRLNRGERVLLRFVPEEVYLAQLAAQEPETAAGESE